MGYHNRGKVKLPPFVMVRKDLLQDPEWKKLSSGAKIAWIYLRNNYDYSNGSRETFLSYNQMKEVLGSMALSRALKELVSNKWIEKTKHGGLFGGVCRYGFIGKYKDFHYKGMVV